MSLAYLTIFKKGGEVTVRLIELSTIWLVSLESKLEKIELELIASNLLLNFALILRRRLFDFLKIISLVFLYGGTISSFSLIAI